MGAAGGQVVPGRAGSEAGPLRSTQSSDMTFEQVPALAAELVAPLGIDRGHPRAERGLVDLVEDHAALGQRRAQARVEAALIVALEAHELGRIALDRGLDVV